MMNRLITPLLIASAAASVLAEADPRGDAADASRDIVAVTTAQADGNLTVTVKTAKTGDFATFLLFFDTDANAQTGFQPPADPKYGFEMMVTGEQLMKFSGEARGAWAWTPVGAAKRTGNDDTLTITIEAAALNTKSADISVWAMSGDWMTLIDRAPDDAPLRVPINPVAARPAKPATPMAAPKPNRHLSARERVKNATSYYCYYGSGKVEELSHYDVAILHTPQMKSEDVKRLGELGVVTVGYISVGESEPPQPLKGNGAGPGGFASWYFDKDNDGQPDMNPIWKSYYTNANDAGWRADRVAEARRLVEQYGFDGIFLDTIDTAMANPETAPGMVALVQEFRAALPDAPIVLNQGFPLLPKLAPIADALMLESFTATYDFASNSYMMNYPQSIDHHLMRTQKEILPVLADHPLKVFVLDYAPESETERIQEAANRAATFGFLFAAAPISLDSVYENNVVGKPDPKWLNKLTTPELLSYKLPEAANGFAAGTQIVPSSAFAGYTVEPIVDGIANRSDLHWSKAAWASAEDGEDAWLEFRLPEARSGGTLVVDWEPSHTSKAFVVQVKESLEGTWREVKQIVSNTSASVAIPLPAEPYRAIRLIQKPGEGSVNRPDLMWVAQVHLK